jgi:hypothetical protein
VITTRERQLPGSDHLHVDPRTFLRSQRTPESPFLIRRTHVAQTFNYSAFRRRVPYVLPVDSNSHSGGVSGLKEIPEMLKKGHFCSSLSPIPQRSDGRKSGGNTCRKNEKSRRCIAQAEVASPRTQGSPAGQLGLPCRTRRPLCLISRPRASKPDANGRYQRESPLRPLELAHFSTSQVNLSVPA